MITNLYIYSGLGNIIAILDSLSMELEINSEDVIQLNQQQDIAFDQLIVVLPPLHHENDLDVDIFNNDGSKASNCINGARCVSKFIQDQALLPSTDIRVNTDGGIWNLKAINEDTFTAAFQLNDSLSEVHINHKSNHLMLDCINLGNPHGVTFNEPKIGFDFQKFGNYLQNHESFEGGVNFGLASKMSKNEIKLRVFERGAGETLACGSGACAAAVIGILKKELETPVKVNFELGNLLIDYNEESKIISATGGAEFLEKKEITI